MTKAFIVRQQGGPEVMQFEDVELGEPRAGELKIRNRAIGINFLDTYQRGGLYKMQLPFTPGSEGAGEVIGIGERPRDDGNDRQLMASLMEAGEVVDHQDIHEARQRHAASRAELPRAATQLSRGEAVIPTIFEEP